ncbi:MAG TPA: WD40 repeat domain-containing protein [Terriglobia bacterium]
MAISIFDLSSGRVIQRWKAGPEGYGGVYSLTFAPDGKSLISSQGHERAKEWDPGTGALLRILPGNLPYWNSEQAAAFSPDGRWLALKGRGQCEIVDLAEGSSVRIVAKGLDGEPLGFTSDGRRLAILLDSEVGEGGKHKQDIALWDAESGEAIEVIPLGTYNDYVLRKVLFSSRSNLVVHLQDKTNLSVGSLPSN